MELIFGLYGQIIFLAVATLPVFFIARYIYKNDKDREPISFLIKLFIGGILIVIPIIIVEQIFFSIFPDDYNNLFQLFFSMFFGVALVEEFFKWIIIYKVSFREKHFDSFYDSIVYSTFVSLGFAVFENIMYVFQNGLTTGLLRAVTAIPLHASCGLIMGYFLGLAKQSHINNNKSEQNKFIFMSLFFPILLHAIYNFLMLSNVTLLQIVGFILVIIMNILFFVKIKKLSNANNSFIDHNKNYYCINCGNMVIGNYCQNCGHKRI